MIARNSELHQIKRTSHAPEQLLKTENPHFLLWFLLTVIIFCHTDLYPNNTHRNTHLPCPEFPVCCQAVSCIHEDFGNAQSILNGLQFKAQQVAFDAVSFECLNRGKK